MSSPNPYRPPEATVADQDKPRGSPVKGVIYGVLVDILGTLGASVLLGIAYGIYLAASGASVQEIESAGAGLEPTSPLGLAEIAIGLGFSALGGYVCARVAGQPELKWAAIMGAISSISGFLIALQAASLAFNFVTSAVSFAVVMAGGYLGARRNARP